MKKTLFLLLFMIGLMAHSQVKNKYTRGDKLTTAEINAIDTTRTDVVYEAYNTDLEIKVINKRNGEGWVPLITSTISGTVEWDDILNKPVNLDIDSTDDLTQTDLADYLKLDGSNTMTGDLEMGGNSISGSGGSFYFLVGQVENEFTVGQIQLGDGASTSDKSIFFSDGTHNSKLYNDVSDGNKLKYYNDETLETIEIGSSLTLIDDDTMASATSSNVPSSKSVVTYVSGLVGGYLPLSGGTMTGNLSLGLNEIVNSSFVRFANDSGSNTAYIGMPSDNLFTLYPETSSALSYIYSTSQWQIGGSTAPLIAGLGGTGTRMVVASADGSLSTQEIPSGSSGTDDQNALEVPYTDTYTIGETDVQGAIDYAINNAGSGTPEIEVETKETSTAKLKVQLKPLSEVTPAVTSNTVTGLEFISQYEYSKLSSPIDGVFYFIEPVDSTLYRHYDASVSSSITEDTGVSVWEDMTFNADLSQATAASQPTYTTINGYPAVTFDGVDDYLFNSLPLMYDLNGMTAYIVIYGSDLGDRRILGEYSSISDTPIYAVFQNGTGATGLGKTFIRDDSNATVLNSLTSSSIFDTSIHVVSVVDSGSNVTIRSDGVEIMNEDYVRGALTLDTFGIGAMVRSAVSSYFQGGIMELKIYNTVHDSTVLQSKETELIAKWTGI